MIDIKPICDNYKKVEQKAPHELSLNEIARMKCDLKRLVRAIESGELVPVVHGRWIEEGDIQICSNCGEEHEWAEYRATFCDVCGAKMDLEDKKC